LSTTASPAALIRLIALWERLRSPRAKGALLLVVVGALIVAAAMLPSLHESPLADAERTAFDLEMRLLREYYPRPIPNDVVLVGIDERTEQTWIEPLALWHRNFARALHALAKSAPRAVGVDVVLPERSFDKIIPGLDLSMMRGMLDLKRTTVLVYVQTVNSKGELVPVQQNYGNIIGPENLGIDQQLRDPDTVSRRFSERLLSQTSRPVPTLAGQLLRGMGRTVDEGYIDYSVGAKVSYVPIHEMVDWDVPKLQAAFGGRVVLIGLIGSQVTSIDRWTLPVILLARDAAGAGMDIETAAGRLDYVHPGVLTHLQVMRSHLAGGLLHPIPEAVRWLLVVLAVLAVFVRARPLAVVAAALIVPVVVLASSLASIVSMKTMLPLASIVIAFWTALIVRGVFDAVEAVVERLRLQQSFAGQVSPAVMKEMLGGGLSPGVSGQLAEVCVLFSDVRDFTTLSENMPPAVVTTVLQRYFDKMVQAVHRYDGTVDKFIGDGMMVLFGAPLKSGDSCGEAVQCALAMMEELDQLNLEFEREGLPTLTIGIGVNYGTVTVGNIGSSERHNYSAIGDAVNVAARVEGLTKELGRKIVITEAVVSRIGERFHFDPLGSHKVKGHSPVNVWGIRTARAVPKAAEAEAVQ